MAGEFWQAVIAGRREVKLERVPVPEPADDEVLIKVAYCAVCTWEQRVYSGVFQTYPLAGGHEVSGVVQKAGAGVGHVRPGDKVIVSGLHRCGMCDNCRRGLSNLCVHAYSAPAPEGRVPGPGGFGEYIVRKGEDVFRLAGHVPLAEAALGEPVACVVRSVKKAGVGPGDRVLVIGGGMMGLLHVQLLRGRAAAVVLSEPDPDRRAIALEMGADGVVDPSEPHFAHRVKQLVAGAGPTVVFVAVSVLEAVHQALSVAAPGGRVMMFASQPRGSAITVDPNLFHHKEVTLTGTVSQVSEDFHDAAALISSGKLDLAPFLTSFYPLTDIKAALDEAVENQGKGAHFRVVVQAGSGE